MKNKTNIEVRNNLGTRVSSNMILGKSNRYVSGDILDANAVVDIILEMYGSASAIERIDNVELRLNHLVHEAPEDLDELVEIIEELQNKADVDNVGGIASNTATSVVYDTIEENYANSNDLDSLFL